MPRPPARRRRRRSSPMSAQSPSADGEPEAGSDDCGRGHEDDRARTRRRGSRRASARDRPGVGQHGLGGAVRLFLAGAAHHLHRDACREDAEHQEEDRHGALLEAAVRRRSAAGSPRRGVVSRSTLVDAPTPARLVASIPVSSPPIDPAEDRAAGQAPDERRGSTSRRPAHPARPRRSGTKLSPRSREDCSAIASAGEHQSERDAQQQRPQVVVGERPGRSRPSRTARATSATSSPCAAGRRSACRARCRCRREEA